MSYSNLWNEIFYYKYDDKNQEEFNTSGYCVVNAFNFQSNSEKVGFFKVSEGPKAVANNWNTYNDIREEKATSRKGKVYSRKHNPNQQDFKYTGNKMPIYFNRDKPNVVNHIKNIAKKIYDEIFNEKATTTKNNEISIVDLYIQKEWGYAIIVADIDSRKNIGIMRISLKNQLNMKKMIYDTWYSSKKLTDSQKKMVLSSKTALYIFDSKKIFDIVFDKISGLMKKTLPKKNASEKKEIGKEIKKETKKNEK